MGVIYSTYLDNLNNELLKYINNKAIDKLEKETIVTAVCNSLISCISDSSLNRDFEIITYDLILNKLDIRLANLLEYPNKNTEQLEEALDICEKLEAIIEYYWDNRISLPKLKNVDIKNTQRRIQSKFDEVSFLLEIQKKDRKITEIINNSQLTVDLCSKTLILLNDLEQDVIKFQNVYKCVPSVNHKNYTTFRNKLNSEMSKLKKQEEVNKKLQDNDSQEHTLVLNWKNNEREFRDIIGLAQKQKKLIGECKRMGLQMPWLRYAHPETLLERFELYNKMISIDRAVTLFFDKNPMDMPTEDIYENWSIQLKNMEICDNHNWPYPKLNVTDFDGIVNRRQEEKRKIEERKKRKSNLIMFAICCIFLAGIVIFSYIKYMATHIQIPYSIENAIGKNYDVVLEAFEEQGFKNIECIPVEEGIQESGIVINITINEKEDCDIEKRYKNDSNILIYYSSENRQNIAHLVSDRNKKNASQIKTRLENAGYTNIRLKKEFTEDKAAKDSNEIIINGIIYNGGKCYVSKEAFIVIQTYTTMKSIPLGVDDCIEENYSEVVEILKKEGFSNIKLYRANDLKTGWITTEGSISLIRINGMAFEKGQEYEYDAPITIIVHTFSKHGCDDITEIWPPS